ncbi:hypothetical protein L2E82_18837 [Cichorium intybus]|uniref:Uncharacterized protein n=1 Tax=Cichorium intybus TaxID=13427 RepID=A0ACB9FAH6_CICIN|nr:hypothetical protein L2E82_18837 [Cichorium intybus]
MSLCLSSSCSTAVSLTSIDGSLIIRRLLARRRDWCLELTLVLERMAINGEIKLGFIVKISLQADSMIKCEDSRCNVWQYINCVIILENPMEGILPAPPPKFLGELCRLGHADLFLLTVAHPLSLVQLTVANPPTDGPGAQLLGANGRDDGPIDVILACSVWVY